MKKNRWNTIGKTRTVLAEILTESLNARHAAQLKARPWVGLESIKVVVLPEELAPMRLAGKARLWEDAHSWEGWSRFVRDGVVRDVRADHFISYSTMAEIVRAGNVDWIGEGNNQCIAMARKKDKVACVACGKVVSSTKRGHPVKHSPTTRLRGYKGSGVGDICDGINYPGETP